MASEIYRRPVGTGLTPEELAMLEDAENYPLEYDEDSPKLTPEQIAQFKPANFATMEERAQAMRDAEISLSETVPFPALAVSE